jgi:secondary thiamine-phosphate synthase enzyme
MKWIQETLVLPPRPRGFHLITREVMDAVPDVRLLNAGMLQVFMMHTSASLTLNENASPDVLHDFEAHFNTLVPEDQSYYHHTLEGPDDMPAHLKASLLGASVLLPLANGAPVLGTWQGIYLCEHRDHASARRICITAWGEEA